MSTEQLKNYIQKFMDAHEIPGLAAAVIQNGNILLANGFGVRSIANPQPLTSTCLFHMASVSKPFSATALMQLAEKGQIDLDARLVDYLPYFTMGDERHKAITLQQMLNHISGMPDVKDYEWGESYAADDSLERYARSLSRSKLLFDPGTAFAYSNIAFELLGDIISKVSGLTFEEYMHKNIFQPLGMHHSTFLRPEVPDDLSVTPHGRLIDNAVVPVYPYNRAHAPSSTLHTNAEDACRWMQANLQRGELDGSRILMKESYAELWKPYFRADETRQIGLSWFLGKLHDFTTIGHGGSDDGFRSQILLLPEKQLGVTVMCNMNPATMPDLANALAEICLGFTPAEPLKPVSFPVVKVYAADGFDAAMTYLESMKGKTDQYLMSADHFFNLADQFYESGQPEKSMDISRLGLAVDPKSASLHALLALIHHDQQQQSEARCWLDKALALDAENRVVKYVVNQMSASIQ